jgi:hypothetical protein
MFWNLNKKLKIKVKVLLNLLLLQKMDDSYIENIENIENKNDLVCQKITRMSQVDDFLKIRQPPCLCYALNCGRCKNHWNKILHFLKKYYSETKLNFFWGCVFKK